MYHTDHSVTPTRGSNVCISRFTIVLLGAVLIGMATGRQFEPEMADLCGYVGLLSIACWLSLELVARGRQRQRASTLQRSAEFRLSGQKQWQRLWRLCRGSVSLHQYTPATALQTVPVTARSVRRLPCC